MKILVPVLAVLLLLVFAVPTTVARPAPEPVQPATVMAHVYFNLRCTNNFSSSAKPLVGVPVIATSMAASSTATTRWPIGQASLVLNALATHTVSVELPTLGAFNLEVCYGQNPVEIAPADFKGGNVKHLYLPFEVTIKKEE